MWSKSRQVQRCATHGQHCFNNTLRQVESHQNSLQLASRQGILKSRLAKLETIDTKLAKMETIDTKLANMETIDTKLANIEYWHQIGGWITQPELNVRLCLQYTCWTSGCPWPKATVKPPVWNPGPIIEIPSPENHVLKVFRFRSWKPRVWKSRPQSWDPKFWKPCPESHVLKTSARPGRPETRAPSRTDGHCSQSLLATRTTCCPSGVRGKNFLYIPFLPGRARSSVRDGPELRHSRTHVVNL